MKFSALVLVSVLLSVTGAIASEHHDALAAGVSRRHHHVARNQARSGGSSAPVKRGNGGRCRPRPTPSPAPQNTPQPSSAKQDPLPTTSVPPQPTQNTNNANNNNNGNNGQNNSKLISTTDSCQGIDVGATPDVTLTTGPNGSQKWLMCGIESSGWQPPHVEISDLKMMDLGQALNDPKSPFHACSAFIDKFYQYGAKYGIPAIVLASTAMQESSCNPNTVGGGGEQGLMQITHDKCGGAPGGNCKDIDFNIDKGAQFFATTLSDCGGNVLLALGKYNGYRQGLTYEQATAARYSACCKCQNNLDYIHQVVNGWYQNINVYGGQKLGMYQNLAVCP